MKDITHSFAAIEDELRSQYVVSYKPADFDADGRSKKLVTDRAERKSAAVRLERAEIAERVGEAEIALSVPSAGRA
jgi:hypothetical protein